MSRLEKVTEQSGSTVKKPAVQPQIETADLSAGESAGQMQPYRGPESDEPAGTVGAGELAETGAQKTSGKHTFRSMVKKARLNFCKTVKWPQFKENVLKWFPLGIGPGPRRSPNGIGNINRTRIT